MDDNLLLEVKNVVNNEINLSSSFRNDEGYVTVKEICDGRVKIQLSEKYESHPFIYNSMSYIVNALLTDRFGEKLNVLIYIS